MVTLQTKGESNDDNMLLPLYVYSRPTTIVLGKQWKNITTEAWWAGREMIPIAVFYRQKFEHKSVCDSLVQFGEFLTNFPNLLESQLANKKTFLTRVCQNSSPPPSILSIGLEVGERVGVGMGGKGCEISLFLMDLPPPPPFTPSLLLCGHQKLPC